MEITNETFKSLIEIKKKFIEKDIVLIEDTIEVINNNLFIEETNVLEYL